MKLPQHQYVAFGTTQWFMDIVLELPTKSLTQNDKCQRKTDDDDNAPCKYDATFYLSQIEDSTEYPLTADFKFGSTYGNSYIRDHVAFEGAAVQGFDTTPANDFPTIETVPQPDLEPSGSLDELEEPYSPCATTFNSDISTFSTPLISNSLETALSGTQPHCRRRSTGDVMPLGSTPPSYSELFSICTHNLSVPCVGIHTRIEVPFRVAIHHNEKKEEMNPVAPGLFPCMEKSGFMSFSELPLNPHIVRNIDSSDVLSDP